MLYIEGQTPRMQQHPGRTLRQRKELEITSVTKLTK